MEGQKINYGSAANEFVIQYERLMYKIARQYVSTQVECEDIVQDSLANILKAYDSVRDMERNQKTAYVAAVVRHRSINFLRRKKLEDSIIVASVDDESCYLPAITLRKVDPEEPFSVTAAAEALRLLPETDRYLIEGKYMIGLSDAELAEELHCQPSSIRMKLTKARRRMSEELRKLGETV